MVKNVSSNVKQEIENIQKMSPEDRKKLKEEGKTDLATNIGLKIAEDEDVKTEEKRIGRAKKNSKFGGMLNSTKQVINLLNKRMNREM